MHGMRFLIVRQHAMQSLGNWIGLFGYILGLELRVIPVLSLVIYSLDEFFSATLD